MHTDPDVLALHALGEHELNAADRQHLAACGRCRAEASSLRQVVGLARGAGEADTHATAGREASTGPSPHVWSGIAAELKLSPALREAPPQRTGPALGSSPPGRGERATGPAARRTRTRRVPSLAMAAALAMVIAAVATSIVVLRPQEDAQIQLAARLEPLLPAAGGGDAEIVGTGTPDASLRLTVQDLPDTGGYHEVWLIDLETGQMVSLGVVPGDGPASFAVPPGLDLSRYDVVDISDEPLNGDPTHSGVSLLRGTLA